MKRFMKVHDLDLNQVMVFKKIFEMFDDNQTDELDFEEFLAILNCISNKFQTQQAKELFNIFDVSNDGKITKEEF